jgi:hypothetical protein
VILLSAGVLLIADFEVKGAVVLKKSPGKFQGLVLGMGVEPTLALLQTGF